MYIIILLIIFQLQRSSRKRKIFENEVDEFR